MRVVAILASYNEESFIAGCLEHLFRQDVKLYLIDNRSTDQTVAIAKQYLERGLIGIEKFPHSVVFSWRPFLERKKQLAATLDSDWLMHYDPNKICLPLRSDLIPVEPLHRQLAETQQRLHALKTSLAWKLQTRVRQIRVRFIPSASRRERVW